MRVLSAVPAGGAIPYWIERKAVIIMSQEQRIVIGGVDTHKDVHVAAVIDDRGKILDTSSFETTAAGYRQLLTWLRSYGDLQSVGVEGTGSYGAGLAHHMAAASVEVVEVNRPNRQLRRRRGKSDPVDAEAAARAVLKGEVTTVPKVGESLVESIGCCASPSRRRATRAPGWRCRSAT